MNTSISHPMAREIQLRIILFSVRVLRTSASAGTLAQWRLKDKILSAGLNWFKFTPKWSFGSNILQLKTEVRLITDVLRNLKTIFHIAAQAPGSFKILPQKEALLNILLESEQTRLNVWIHPLGESRQERPEIMTHHGKGVLEVTHPLINST
jgi:phosphatidylinositol 4-kinase A